MRVVIAEDLALLRDGLERLLRDSGFDVVAAVSDGDLLVVQVADDGVGGADVSGSGLTGLRKRVEALDGRLAVTSPAGGPTTIRAELPCGS